MSQRRGLVVERSGDKVTAITKDGEFVTWRDRRDLMPGEEVLVPSPRFQGFFWRRLIPATALATVLIVTSFFGYRHYLYARPVLAYVTFDSSGEVPVSIELEVNDRGLVRRAVPLDEAGATALLGINATMQPVQTVLSKLRQAIPDSKVIIAFIPVTETQDPGYSDAPYTGPEDRLSSLVMGLAEKVFDAIREATAVMLDMETRAVAQELGISAGRAASWALWNLEVDDSPEAPVSPGIYAVPDPGQAEPGAYEPLDPAFSIEPFSTETQGSSHAGEGDDEPVGPRPIQGMTGDPAGSGGAVQSGTPSQPGHPGAGSQPSHGTAGTEPAEPGASTRPGDFEEPRLSIPPGQAKKIDAEALLDMIKSGLPHFSWKDDDKPLSKKSSKELEKLTKDWLNSLLEASKKASQKDKDREEEKDDHKKPTPGNPKPGSSNGVSSGNKGGNQEPGKGQEKPGKPDKPGKPGKDEKPEKPEGSKAKGKDEKPDNGKGKGATGGSSSVKGKDQTKQGGSALGDRFKWTSEFLKRLWK